MQPALSWRRKFDNCEPPIEYRYTQLPARMASSRSNVASSGKYSVDVSASTHTHSPVEGLSITLLMLGSGKSPHA